MRPQLTLGLFRAAEEQLEEAMTALGMVEGTDVRHQFEPHGTSWVRFSERGRVVFHTWPERKLISVDVWSEDGIDLNAQLATLGWIPVDGAEQ